MDIKKACEILDINIILLTNDILKKQYHLKSLQHHPDKNGNTLISNEKFREINEAYLFLKSSINERDNDEELCPTNYIDLLNLFMNEFANKKLINELKDIILNCSYTIFEKLSKSYSLELYCFLLKNKDIFHISSESLLIMFDIINKKEIQIIILNPTIDDLFENNIYKLIYKNSLYLVPLWHSEVYFDDNDEKPTNNEYGVEFVVKCFPTLPNTTFIDEDNNFIVNIEILFEVDLLNKNGVYFKLGKKQFCVPMNELCVSRTQTYTFKNQGISKIKDDEIYNIEDKSDVIVIIKFF